MSGLGRAQRSSSQQAPSALVDQAALARAASAAQETGLSVRCSLGRKMRSMQSSEQDTLAVNSSISSRA